MESRGSVVQVQGAILCFVGLFLLVTCSPKCLDKGSPYELSVSLEFCAEYGRVACCTPEKDADIKKAFELLKLESSSTGCGSYVKELMCLECSPYAAKIFQMANNGSISTLPGLCPDYCDAFHSKCISTVTKIYGIQSLRYTQNFCEVAKLEGQDEQYCYPSLLSNQRLIDKASRPTAGGCLCLKELATELANPLVMRMSPDKSGRIFIGEQQGLVKIFYKDGTKIDQPFLDIRNDVQVSSNEGVDDRGFLNIVFHPNFKENKKFYIFYSTNIDGQHHSRISEFKESSVNENRVDTSTQRIILDIEQPETNQNGGELLFGPDGYLYVFLGDGGGVGDPNNYAQNKSVLLGKILRIDIDTNDPAVGYTVPADNPFIGEKEARGEIWAYGFRNPWRCDFDEGDTVTGCGKGRLFCGDVGQDSYEEVDLVVKGGNYEWSIKEGPKCYKDEASCENLKGQTEPPIFAYPHTEGSSVTGGKMYRGCLNPRLREEYIFGDFMTGGLWSLAEDRAANIWRDKKLSICQADSNICSGKLTTEYPPNILSFGEDDDGEVYILSTSFTSPTDNAGKVLQIVDPHLRGDVRSCRTHESYQPPITSSCQNDDNQTSDSVSYFIGQVIKFKLLLCFIACIM